MAISSALNQPQQQKKKLPKLFDFDDERLESLREFSGGLTHSLKKDLAEDGAKDLWQQILGKYEKNTQSAKKLAGELQEGEEFDLSAYQQSTQTEQAPTPKRQDIAPGLEQYNYYRDIARSSERSQASETRKLDSRVSELLVEISQLVATSKDVEAQFTYVAVEQKPVEVGKYHTNFFEWMLLTIRNARMKIEDAGNWLSVMAGKKNKRNYWSQFKKHGTSFGLSNERTVATQTG